MHCNTLQYTETHCNTLQPTATGDTGSVRVELEKSRGWEQAVVDMLASLACAQEQLRGKADVMHRLGGPAQMVHTHTHTHTQTLMCKHIYTHTHNHTHTYAHTHTRTHTNARAHTTHTHTPTHTHRHI